MNERGIIFYICIIPVIGEIISTKNGQISGSLSESYNGKPFLQFEGIPYAKPPVGELRFKEPSPVEPWEGVKQANRFHKCVHILAMLMKSAFGEEDCLYLNVYVAGAKIDANAKKDVIVHIHGGAFTLGSPGLMARPGYIMSQDVVYVSMNYRLGIFGFLSTQDEVVPGNNGLKDQTLALKWIKENIADFGGNPESITLTGISAGAASVYYHYLSPKSKGLFHRGYAMSGSPLNPWAFTERPREKTVKLANVFNCSTESSELMVDCLRTVPALQLGNAMKEFTVFMDVFPVTPFGPVKEPEHENAFIADDPYKLLLEGKLESDVPLIMSNVAEEGIYPAGAFVTFGTLSNVDKQWNELAPYLLDFHDTIPLNRYAEVAQKIRTHYFKDGAIDEDNLPAIIKLFSDRLFFLGSQLTLKLHRKAAKAPFYYMMSFYSPTQMGLFPSVKGASHISDAKMMFQLMVHPTKLSESDEGMVEFFTSMLSSYAKNGIPSIENIVWKTFDQESESNYLCVNSSNEFGMRKFMELASVEFWDSLDIKENNLNVQ